MSRDDAGSNLFFLLTGAAIGAALGVLFAPQEGSRTREQLTDWLKERRERGENLLDKVKDQGEVKKDALVAAAKAAKEAYRDANAKHHGSVSA